MNNYDDIINLPHFHAPGRGFMPTSERAAQFAPFKSLGRDHDVDKNEFLGHEMTVEYFDDEVL